MRFSRLIGMLLSGFLALLIVGGGAAAARVPAAAMPATGVPAAAAPAAGTVSAAGAAPVIFGLGDPTDGARFATQAALGVKAAIVGSFATQTNSPDFWLHWAQDVRADGAVVQLFWDPTPGITNDPHSSLRSIIAGEHDTYIRHWASMVRSFGHPVVVRLMAEMNGNWQPYSPGINGNTASEFPVAGRHVVDVARSAYASNILWDWNPNKPSAQFTPIASLWPGSSYVDWIGLDVYNWGDTAHGPWSSFSALMGPAVTAIRAVAGNKPLMLNEVGTNTDGDKAGWLTEMFRSLPGFGVKAVVYFDYAMEGADWRLSSPSTAMAATKVAVQAAPYVTGDRQAVAVTEQLLTSPSNPAPHTVADFDGNGSTDLAVYRPTTGGWYVRSQPTATWGRPGDLPVPADYNGDRRTDIAVWRPSDTRWYVAGSTSVAYGASGDVPVPGDYNGDGRADVAVWRPSTGTWWIRGLAAVSYGRAGDIPVPGDYNGDGRTDIAVFRPSTGTWWMRGVAAITYGRAGDVPVPGDFTNDGRCDLAVFRPSTATWYVRGGEVRLFGSSGDVPAPGDYNADGATDLAVFKPITGTWLVRGSAGTVWGVSSDDSLPLPQGIRSRFGM